MKTIGMQRSKADPCMYFSWTPLGLVIIISLIDNNLIVGCNNAVMKVTAKFVRQFEYDDIGKLVEYVGIVLIRRIEIHSTCDFAKFD